MQKKWIAIVQSRKFWAALAGLLMVFLRGLLPDFPVEDDQLVYLVVVIASYILGTAIEDAGKGDYLSILPGSEQPHSHEE